MWSARSTMKLNTMLKVSFFSSTSFSMISLWMTTKQNQQYEDASWREACSSCASEPLKNSSSDPLTRIQPLLIGCRVKRLSNLVKKRVLTQQVFIAAVIMGLGIAITHYTAMEALTVWCH